MSAIPAWARCWRCERRALRGQVFCAACLKRWEAKP